MKKALLPLLALFSITGCFGPEPQKLDFVDTIVLSPDFVNFNAVRLKGQILHQTPENQGECGFIWSYDRAAVENLEPSAQRIVLNISNVGSDGNFESPLNNLNRNSTIYIRTFARLTEDPTGERLVYSSKTESFAVGEIVFNTGTAIIRNDTAWVSGQLQGIIKPVEQYGHVISQTAKVPFLGGADCQYSNNGASNDNLIFQSAFNGLHFNTSYYMRAYAVAYGDTFYSQKVDTFRMRDGWERINDFDYGYAEGAAAVVNGKAYAGLGCKKAFECMVGELKHDFWQFDATAQGGLGEWTQPTMFPDSFLEQYNNTAFALNGKYYAVFGETYIGSNHNVLKDMFTYDPVNQQWRQYYIPDSVFPVGRTGTVAFALGDFAYIGAGRSNDLVEFNDFWQFNPVTNHWRKVASLPMQTNPAVPVSNLKGRFEAVSFTIDGYAYVGSGQYGNLELKDFWRFRPPVNDQDPGEWIQIEFLPQEAPGRYQAVAMSIGKKGYIGTGYNAVLGYLGDWWEYDPDSGHWKARTSFPAQARTNAMGFAIDQHGYLGAGHTKVLIDGGLSATEYSLNDFWRYVPEK